MSKFRVLAPVLAGGVFACMTSASSARADAPSSMQVTIESIAGTGCPPGSVVPQAFQDASGFMLTFLQYDVKTPEPLHRFCNVTTRVKFPSGWSFSVAGATYNGFASLGRGVDGIFSSKYWFPGTTPIGKQTFLASPHFGPFSQTDTFGVVAWSPCGGHEALLNIKTEAGLSSANSPSYMNVQDQDLNIFYTCRWRHCR